MIRCDLPSLPLCLLSLLLTCLVLSNPAGAAAKADLWPVWQASNQLQTQSIDHSVWQSLLATYVVEEPGQANRVRYGAVTAEDKARLDAYITHLTSLAIRDYPRQEQLAFWINLYNALTVQLIISHYPVTSIKAIRISPGWFSVGPWGKKLIEVEGYALSLDDIEHRILRPIFKDPRIHYAVNCAALGCPDLNREAYTIERVDELLTGAARRYINHPRGVWVINGGIRVSSIYDWFAEDFGDTDAAVLAHLKLYAAGELRTKLAEADSISDYAYDWSLNDISTPRP